LAKVPAWQIYQEQVASYLRSLGFEAETDVSITGVRGVHAIDVVARFKQAGLNVLWIIECKLWNRPVSKAHVLTLTSIVGDVGADRGLVLSESGFQAGAVAATNLSNTTLTSLSQMRENTAGELREIRIQATEDEADDYRVRFLGLANAERKSSSVVLRFPKGIDGTVAIGFAGRLSFLINGLKEARRDRWPIAYVRITADMPVDAHSFDELQQANRDLLDYAKRGASGAGGDIRRPFGGFYAGR
jgi:hypothetical protein